MRFILAGVVVLLFGITPAEAFQCSLCKREVDFEIIERPICRSFAQVTRSLEMFQRQFPSVRSLPTIFPPSYSEYYDPRLGLTIYDIRRADIQVTLGPDDGAKQPFSRYYELKCLYSEKVSEQNLVKLTEQGLFPDFNPKDNEWRTKIDITRWDGIKQQKFSYTSYSSINFLFEHIHRDLKAAFAFSSEQLQEALSEYKEGIEGIRKNLREMATRFNRPDMLNETLCSCNKNTLLTYFSGCSYCLLRSYNKSLEDHQKVQDLLVEEQNKAHFSFENAEEEIIGIFHSIYDNCIKKHRNRWSYYQRGLIYFHQGHIEKALRDIKALLETTESNQLPPKLYFEKGSMESELGLYHDAIESLNIAIDKDPMNKDSYFERAAVYFELGDFDRSLEDYLRSGVELEVLTQSEGNLWDFSVGFARGAKNGVVVASGEFIPSILSSARGIGQFLWTMLENPIENSKMLAMSTIDLYTYLKTCDKAELAQILVPEMYELVIEWDNLPFSKRGEIAGYCLGKYGTDILLPVAVLKGANSVKTVYQIKKAER